MRAGIYARVSTDEQAEEGHSIDAQIRINRTFVENKGWTIVGEYVDDGYSGRTLERPAIQRLLVDVRNKKIDVIVVHKLDRISRSVVDTLTLINDWDKQSVSFVSITENFDLTSPFGKAMLGVVAVFSQLYVENLSTETVKGKHQRVLKGFHNNTVPFGYVRVKKEDGGIPKIDPNAIEGYRLAIRMCARGASVREIVLALNNHGYRTSGNWGSRPFSEDTVLPMVKSKFYLGMVSYKGEWFPGKHEAAIEAETWERAQEQLRQRAVNREGTKLSDRTYPLRKLLRCAVCGRGLRGQISHGVRRYRDPSLDYGENCPEVASISAEVLEGQIGEYLSRMKLPMDWKEKVMARLTGERSRDASESSRSRLMARLERTKKLFQFGDLTEEEYRKEKSQIEKAIAELPAAIVPERDLSEAARLLENFGEIWTKATDPERLRLLQASINRAYVKGGRIVAIEPRAAMYPLLALADGFQVRERRDSNPRSQP
jgi:site-specific DNA recombinase